MSKLNEGCRVLLLTLMVLACSNEKASPPTQKADGRSWDSAYLTETPPFRLAPNVFLTEAVAELEPGRALDVGMGQGRNALYLAQQGWEVTGFDVSEAGIAKAREQARELDLELSARLESSETFDWGRDRWDLIVAAYFPNLRQSLSHMLQSLKPGGFVVVEAYHVDAARDRPPGPGAGVTFDSNELLSLFRGFRVLRYEDVRDTADWGLFETRIVRLLAQKQ